MANNNKLVVYYLTGNHLVEIDNTYVTNNNGCDTFNGQVPFADEGICIAFDCDGKYQAYRIWNNTPGHDDGFVVEYSLDELPPDFLKQLWRILIALCRPYYDGDLNEQAKLGYSFDTLNRAISDVAFAFSDWY